jgi:hypothetical protein
MGSSVETPEEAQEDAQLELIGGMEREDAGAATDAEKVETKKEAQYHIVFDYDPRCQEHCSAHGFTAWPDGHECGSKCKTPT